MDRQSGNQQMVRERAAYRYLEALDTGDIDAVIDVLQQAFYDAPLEQMVLEAHQALFQEEQAQKAALVDMETQVGLPAPAPRRLARGTQRQAPRRVPRWMQVLAALLIMGVLVGSFLTLSTLRHFGSKVANPRPSPSVCQSDLLKQFDLSYAASDPINTLNAVTTISANDAWAVGSTSSVPSPAVNGDPFIEHWDGKSWRVVSSPNRANSYSSLTAVAAISAKDVWAVGYSSNRTVTTDGPLLPNTKTLIEHWNGADWQIIASPNSPSGNGFLHALAAISANDIWAVGSFSDTAQLVHPLLEHWNGRSWRIVSFPGNMASAPGILNDVAATSAHDVWVAGISRSSGGIQGLIEHWNGSQWQIEPAPPTSRELQSVSVISARDLWAAGVDTHDHPLIEHWDGQQWNSVPFPSPTLDQGGYAYSSYIVAVSASDVWAVENLHEPNGQNRVFVLHWNGKAWQPVNTSVLRAPPNLLNAIASGIAYGEHQVWIVGQWSDSDGGYTSAWILGQRTCP